MMKLFLLLAAFIALVQSENALLSCYECKSASVDSSRDEFKNFRLCEGDQKQWPIKNITNINFQKCKKLVEKVKVDGKDDELVIRTVGPSEMGLDKKLFSEYTCETNLCNSAVTMCATAIAVLSSIAAALATHL